MAEKMLNTRIQLKYDSWTAWADETKANQGANLILKQGEVGICNIPASTNAGQSTSEPVVLFKVGNGTAAFKDLPWASAKAADVHAWAKKSEAEFKTWVQSLIPVDVSDTGTGKFVTGVTATNDATGHHITITRADVAWTDLTGTSPIGNGDLAINIGEGLDGDNLGTTMNSNEDVTITISHGAKPVEGTDATATTGTSGNRAVTSVQIDKFGHVSGVTTGSIIDNDTQTKVTTNSKYLSVALDHDAFMSDEVNTYTINVVENELKALIGAETTAAMEFKGAVAALPTGTHNKGDMYKLTAAVTVAPAKDAQGAGFTTKPGDAIVYDADDKWYLIPAGDDTDDTWRQVFINESSIGTSDLEFDNSTTSTTQYGILKINGQEVKTQLVIPDATDEQKGLVTLGDEGGAEIYGTAAQLLAGLDAADKTGDFVTAVTQTNGQIAVTKGTYSTSYLNIAGKDSNNIITLHTDLQLSGNNQLGYDAEDDQTITFAPIAATGNVNDLVQTTGDVIVFNCGSATTII